jgi:hypothetical protein
LQVAGTVTVIVTRPVVALATDLYCIVHPKTRRRDTSIRDREGLVPFWETAKAHAICQAKRILCGENFERLNH